MMRSIPGHAAAFPGRTCARAAGLSLPEVVVCLAIIALLAAYAMPGYRSQRMRGYRMDAVTALYRAVHYEERRRSDAAQMPGAGDGNPAETGGGPMDPRGLPPELAQTPANGAAVYRLALLAAGPDNGGFTIEASPADAGPMQDDRMCGSYLLDATGKRANRAGGEITQARVALCWEGRPSPGGVGPA